MLKSRDTFLHFLADNLVSVTLHPRRYDENDPSLIQLKEGAVNVEFMELKLGREISTQMVAIDVIHADEGTAVAWMAQLWTLLRAAFYTPLLDYTDTENPVDTGTNLMWDPESVRFRKVYSEHYCHYVCVLPLQFHT